MTDWEFLAMQNSTSVRSPQPPLAARLLRPGVAMLSALAPALAARVAERLFVTAPRYPVPAHETAVLAGARRTIVHVDGAPVTTWTWGHGPRVLLVHGPGCAARELRRTARGERLLGGDFRCARPWHLTPGALLDRRVPRRDPGHRPHPRPGARHRRALDRHGGRRAGVARRPPRRRRRLHRAAGGPDLTVAHASRGARLWTAGA